MAGTGAPVPSNAFSDLEVNMDNADNFVNSTAVTFTNRTTSNGNVTSRTIAGINAAGDLAIAAFSSDGASAINQFNAAGDLAIAAFSSDGADAINQFNAEGQQAINNLSYAVGWNIVADFAIGETVTNANDVLRYEESLYRVIGALPWTTDGATPASDSRDWVAVANGETKNIARALNILDSEVFFSTDTFTALEFCKVIYDSSVAQKSWYKPIAVGDTETIVSVVGDVLTTNVGVYDLVDRGERFADSVNVKDFGAVGDGVADDTIAIQSAINYAQSFIINQWLDGVSVYLPSGNYRITSTLNITEDNIGLFGDALASSTISASNPTFDYVYFDGSAGALFGCSCESIRFQSSGAATTGAHIRARRLIYATFRNIYSNGGYWGIITDGCAKTYYSDIILTQDGRSSGAASYAFDFKSTVENNSDVHLSNIQVFQSEAFRPSYSISIRGSDGIYVNNAHIHGGVLVQPSHSTCASVFFTQTYFDKSAQNHFNISGGAAAYRSFFFSNCYFREAEKGLVIDTTTPFERLQMVNCQIGSHSKTGVEIITATTKNIIINGCLFDSNNTDNSAAGYDIRVQGSSAVISGCIFSGGGDLGTACYLGPNTDGIIVDSCNFTDSDAANMYVNAGLDTNVLGMQAGYVVKKTGDAVISAGATSVTVNHGLSVTPGLKDLLATPRTNLAGRSFWVSSATSTTFDINMSATDAGSAVFSWSADVTK